MHHLRTNKWHPTAGTLPPQCSLRYVQQIHHNYAQNETEEDNSPENFLAFNGCFELITYCIMGLGWLKKGKKREEKEYDDFDFQLLKIKSF